MSVDIASALAGVRSRTIWVDGIRTHYLEAGDGPDLVMLHDGSYGGCARLCWTLNIAYFSRRWRVIAPDWLGFGTTAKLHDFDGARARRLWHMTRLLETLGVSRAPFFGSSMGATLLLQIAASGEPQWPIAAIVSASGGGFIPLNDARKRALDFDCTLDGMRTVLSSMVHDPRWVDEPWLLQGRYETAIQPGAWEAVAAARFKSPITPPRSDFGAPDATRYEDIDVPTLLVAGINDKLREEGYAHELQVRIKDSELLNLDKCGHFPQIEQHELFNSAASDFLSRRLPGILESGG
jgi:pimeloyl-ACP methyl ester carboxylesterase